MTGEFVLTACSVVAALILAPVPSAAQSLVTFSCDEPKGFSMRYGISSWARIDAEIKKQPVPTEPQLTGPTEDGFTSTLTFILNKAQQKLTVTWNPSASEVETNKHLMKMGMRPAAVPETTELRIVTFGPFVVSAIEADIFGTATYSFFPKLGKAFIAEQRLDLPPTSAFQMATIASCIFPPDFPGLQ
jgi:hypothetical protein